MIGVKSPSFTPRGAGEEVLYQFKLTLGKMVFPMRRRELIALLLCLLILSNMATYLYPFFFLHLL